MTDSRTANRRPLTQWEQRVSELLSDGVARTPSDIMRSVSGTGSSFTQQQQVSRQVMPSLYSLRERGKVIRMVYYVQQRYPDGPHVPIDRYVATHTVAPVCVPCWRRHWPDLAENGGTPPQAPGYPAEYCSFCLNRTKDGSYAAQDEIVERGGVIRG